MAINHVTTSIYKDILAGKASLPSVPDVSIRIRKAMQNPDYTIETVTKVLQVDPALSAHLLKISQSPIYRRQVSPQNLVDAVSRMGMTATKNFAVSYTLKSLYSTPSVQHRKTMIELWKQSAKTAAICSVIASRIPNIDPDESMLSGLLLDLGALIILDKLDKNPEYSGTEEETQAFIHECAAPVGVVLLKSWGFDEPLVNVVRHREDWLFHTEEDISLTDIAIVARLHHYAGSPKMKSLPALTEIPSFEKVSIALEHLNVKKSMEFLTEAQQNINAILKLLS